MKLWTYQGVAQSLTSGTVDHSKSSYYNNYECVRNGYEIIKQKIGTNKLIWCWVRDPKRPPKNGEVRLCLDVPESKVIKFIDERVWSRILGFPIAAPTKLRHKWECERPENETDSLAYQARREQEYLAEPPPSGCWCNHLFIERSNLVLDGDDEQLPSALVEHPILDSWIIPDSP